MFDAISAEMIKLLRMRATWLLAWIYPILFALLTAGVLIYGLTTGHGPNSPPDPLKWSAETANFWLFPQTAFGRYLVASFAVFCTASEYGWNTWKLIVPARSRWQLLSAKVIVALLLLLLSFVLTAIIAVAGAILNAALVGPAVPRGLDASMVWEDHYRGLISIIAPTVYTVVLATFLAVLTRSALAALLISVGLITIEGLLPMAAAFAYPYAPSLTEFLSDGLPFYHLANVMNWTNHGSAFNLRLDASVVISASIGKSLAIAGLWTSIIGAAAMLHFARQDLD